MLIRKCEQALHQVRKKTPHGAGNFSMNNESDLVRKKRQEQVEAVYLISKIIAMMPFAWAYYQNEQDGPKHELILEALFAEALGFTNCGGAAGLGVMELLQAGIEQSIEVIAINSGLKEEHAFVILNRKKEEEIKKDLALSDVIYFDAWRKINLTQSFEGDNIFTADKLLSLTDTQSIITIKTVFRIEHNFTASDWLRLSSFLKDAAKQGAKIIKDVCSRNNLPANTIINKFNEKADFYSELAQPAMLNAVGYGRVTCAKIFGLFDRPYFQTLPREIRDQKLGIENGAEIQPLPAQNQGFIYLPTLK